MFPVWLSVVRSLIVYLSIGLAMFMSTTLSAQVPVPAFVEESITQQADVDPPFRPWDWLQLTSGEWLKGDVKVIYEEVLEFDSDELGLLTFDMEDIEQLRSDSIARIRVEGVDQVIHGIMTLDKTQIRVTTAMGDAIQIDRRRLISMIFGIEKEQDRWVVRAGLGFSGRQGNSRQAEYNGEFNALRRSERSRYSFDYKGIISTTSGIETANNHRVRNTYDIFARQRLYYRPLVLDLVNDEFQNIQIRGTYGAEIGYHILNNSRTEWEVSSGPGWQWTNFDIIETDERDDRENSPVWLANMRFDHELTSTIDLVLSDQITLANSQSGGLVNHFETAIDFELTGQVDLRLSFIWDFTEVPAEGDEGETPDQSDYRLLLNLGYEFN